MVSTWHNESFGEDGLLGRDNNSEVVLEKHLVAALSCISIFIVMLAF